MHGLINRSIQCFIRDTYGDAAWLATARRADCDTIEFDTLGTYDDALSEALMDAASVELGRPRPALLESLGTYLVTHPGTESVRRLLRFTGTGFTEFLFALEDLQDRARLAIPDLDLPRLSLRQEGPRDFELSITAERPDVVLVLVGVLRAMADDYGALVLLDPTGHADGIAGLRITLLDVAFAEGRSFDLAGAAR